MTQATVTPKYVNQPKPGGKMGSIKDSAGELWLLDPGLLASFSPGRATTVEWASFAYKDGGTGKKITGIVHGASTNGSAAPQPAHGNQGREIFITGVVGRAMGSGKFGFDEIPNLTRVAAAAWEIVTGHAPQGKPAPPDEGLNDSVPF